MPRMLIALLAAIALVATACGRGTPDTGTGPEPSSEPLPSAGSSLSVGLHELADGSIVAVGVLRRIDLEGGFWAITDPADRNTDQARWIVVISNSAELEDELAGLEGALVRASGERFEGASIRMAGPEMMVEAIEALDENGSAER